MIDTLIAAFQSITDSLKWSLTIVNIFEILIIASTLYLFYHKFIKNTQSEKLVKGLFILIFGWILSEVLTLINLRILGLFLKGFVTLVSLSIIVIFQPELRRFLGYLGQPGVIGRTLFSKNGDYSPRNDDIDVIKEVIEAVKYLTKTKTGALIVFKRGLNTGIYPDVGTKIDGRVSTELILTIFHPNTPLHDGALVIDGNKVQSAGVLLPLTEDPKLSWKYGTRHRAALGMSEVSDSACLVVSEETGDVSICMDGSIKKYEDLKTLKEDLEVILGLKKYSDENIVKHKNFFDFFKNK